MRAPRANRDQTADRLALKQLSKIANAVTPFRVGARKQMVSVPNHNYQLKIRKNFRLACGRVGVDPFNLDMTKLIAAVRNELGIAAPTANIGEMIAIHSLSVYGSLPSLGTLATANIINDLNVKIFDIENTGGATGLNTTAMFEDQASPAGVTHVKVIFPLNDRPTFNTAITNTNLAVISTGSADCNLCIDADISYVRTPNDGN